MGLTRPVIGITADVSEPKAGSVRMECSLAYCRAVVAAGGDPVVLPPMVELIPRQLEMCGGFVLTGGDDPRMEMFGMGTHAAAKPMHALRQEYEVSLLKALEDRGSMPVLGVCLGMQLMALCAGGRLNQHMPDEVATAREHAGNAQHDIHATVEDGVVAGILKVGGAGAQGGGAVVSHHRQAVSDPGRLRVAARAPDGVIEAVDDPSRRFYVGVQWHPERTGDGPVGAGVFAALVAAARR